MKKVYFLYFAIVTYTCKYFIIFILFAIVELDIDII